MRKPLVILVLLFVGAQLFAQKILKEGTLRYYHSTMLEHPSMGSLEKPLVKDLQISFTENHLRVNSLTGKALFQKITPCASTQTDVYANNQTSFYLVQSPRMGEFFEFGPLGKIPPAITYLEDSALLQGYPCKKAIVESALSETDKLTMEVWYLPDYQISAGCFNYYFQDLKGIPVVIRYHEKSRMQINGQNLMVTAEYKLLNLDVKSPAQSITQIDKINQYKLVKKGEEAARLMEIAMSINRQTSPENKMLGSTPSFEVKKVNTNPFEIGTPLKAFSGEGLNGELISLDQYKGKVLVINFWFAQCAPCIEEMPVLNSVMKDANPNEVGFLSITFNTADVVNRFLQSKEFTFDKIVNARELINDMKVTSFPVTLVVDKNGIIQYTASGNVLSVAELENQIKLASSD